MNQYKERVEKLQNCLIQQGIDFYLIPSSDYHNSEYVLDFFKLREFYSGFTGSNGTLLVTQTACYLWTDGRYFVQAENELKGTDIQLMRMGEPDVPRIAEFIKLHAKENAVLGFDGQVVNAAYAKEIAKYCQSKKLHLLDTNDFAGSLWENRPAICPKKVYEHRMEYAGETVCSKLQRVKQFLKEEGQDYLFLSKLDDIMWLFNIRGNDIACNPVAMSYAYISEQDTILFLYEEALTEELKAYFCNNQIAWYAYEAVFDFLEKTAASQRGIAPLSEINYRIYQILYREENESFIDKKNPLPLWKSVKNESEMKHMRDFFLQDSACVCRFIYWLKNQSKQITEMDAAAYLGALREKIDGYMGLSFETISAYGPNAAMMHYEADEVSNATMEEKGFLLVDSGGQYMGATTDVTRTIVMGELSERESYYFTLVAMGMLRLQNAVFPEGCTGRNLDILARQPLWEQGVDYKCGTGHGVGYFLNVHEGPQSIRWKYVADAPETVLVNGMTVTDEPGVYFAGEFGIRTENTLLVKEKMKTQDGTFLAFEPLTFVPIDLDAIQVELMQEKDLQLLNDYHQQVYDKISPYLNASETAWLKQVTRPVFRA